MCEQRIWRLELRIFDGSNVFRAERFFMLNRMTDGEKLDATVVSFEGEARGCSSGKMVDARFELARTENAITRAISFLS